MALTTVTDKRGGTGRQGGVTWFAVSAPGVDNDITQGVLIGDWFLNTSAKTLYICMDNAAGAADWNAVTQS